MTSEAPLQLTICRVGEVNALLRERKFDAILSIKDPSKNHKFRLSKTARRQRQLSKHAAAAMCLDFEDDDQVQHCYVVKIVQFAQELPRGARVLVHCMAGISRSTAAATILLCEMGMALDDARAEVVRVRPIANPNTKMLAHYAELLSLRSDESTRYDGALLESVSSGATRSDAADADGVQNAASRGQDDVSRAGAGQGN